MASRKTIEKNVGKKICEQWILEAYRKVPSGLPENCLDDPQISQREVCLYLNQKYEKYQRG